MACWLFKSEPNAFSLDDLIAMPNQTEHWDGVRNYQARNMLRDQIKNGDKVFFYHSNCKVPGIVGTAKVVRESYPDFTQFDPEDGHYDPKSQEDNPRWFMVDIKFCKQFKSVISLESLKQNPALSDMALVRKGNRLSVMPVTEVEWQAILLMV
jgi:predicted RNA-binding protein with PUA-like domain